jgi:hypothetical protein
MRRAHLINPFGTGAMSTLVNGVSVITASLDAWFHDFNGHEVPVEEMEVVDWRLMEKLKVNALRLPPRQLDDPFSWNRNHRSLPTSFVPVLRFPSWNKCQFCNTLTQLPTSFAGTATCSNPTCNSKSIYQASIVVVCEKGHLDDFPWSAWAHKDPYTSCKGPLKLTTSGGGSLSNQFVSCTIHEGAKRSLQNIVGTQIDSQGLNRSNLSRMLSTPGHEYKCTGYRPWASEYEACEANPVAVLRTSSNVYFGLVESSIYIPPKGNYASPALLRLLNQPIWRIKIQNSQQFVQISPQVLRQMDQDSGSLKRFIDEDLDLALQELVPNYESISESSLGESAHSRLDEFDLFVRDEVPHPFLKVSTPYDQFDIEEISKIRRVDTLCETRALRGFTRLKSDSVELEDGKKMLFSKRQTERINWLPAYQVRGEGIFIELNQDLVQNWSSLNSVKHRTNRIINRVNSGDIRPSLVCEEIDPGYFLIHTLSHLLIRQLIFDSGYSTASLRERMYVDRRNSITRYGSLIYTAAGDSEGTLGGLVALAEGKKFSDLLQSALESARWCSTDPVCLELGGQGQGPELCNLAACHTCALLPETSCEDMNKFLDRGLLIGDPNDSSVGFFQNILS